MDSGLCVREFLRGLSLMHAGFGNCGRGGYLAGFHQLFELAQLVLQQLASRDAQELPGHSSDHAGGGGFQLRAHDRSAIRLGRLETNVSSDRDALHRTGAPAKALACRIFSDLDSRGEDAAFPALSAGTHEIAQTAVKIVRRTVDCNYGAVRCADRLLILFRPAPREAVQLRCAIKIERGNAGDGAHGAREMAAARSARTDGGCKGAEIEQI